MPLTRRQRLIRYGIAGTLIAIVFVLPVLLGFALRGSVQAKVEAALNAPVQLGSLSIHLLPPGATLSGLVIGKAQPEAGNQPLIAIDSVRASVALGTVLGGDPHVTSLRISSLNLNAAVDAKGESSFSRFVRELPVSSRKSALPIDSLSASNVRIHTYLHEKVALARAPQGTADATLDVGSVSASNLLLPPPGELLGSEVWTELTLRDIHCTAPALEKAESPSDGLVDGAHVAKLEAELAQATSTRTPVRIRRLDLSGAEAATVYTQPGHPPALTRALAALKLAFGESEPAAVHESGNKPPAPTGTGLLIESLSVENSKIETRGPDASGKLAWWRLNTLTLSGANLAIGPEVAAQGNGSLKIGSASESTSGPGKLSLALTNITGGFPRWSFDCDYKLENVAAPPFSVAAEEATSRVATTKLQAGLISMEFNGPAKNGKLEIDGSLTLSPDFEVTGTLASQVVKLTRGKPIKTIRVRGTLENPKVSWPDAIAGTLGNAFEKILTGGPIGIVDTASEFMGSAVGQGVREATKVIPGGSDIIKKLPGFLGGKDGEK